MPKPHCKTGKDRLAYLDQAKKILLLRRQGKLHREIAAELGLKERRVRYILLKEVGRMKDHVSSSVEKLREEHNRKLLAMIAVRWQEWTNNPSVENEGALIRLLAEHAKRNGIDSPQRTEITQLHAYTNLTVEQLRELAQRRGITGPEIKQLPSAVIQEAVASCRLDGETRANE